MVRLVEDGVLRQLAGEEPGGERHPGEDADIVTIRLHEEAVRGSLTDDVVDDLDRGDAGKLDGLEGLLDALHAHAVGGDRLRGDQVVEGQEDLGPVVDGGREAVQLDEVEAIDAKVVTAPVDPAAEGLRRVQGQVQGGATAHLRCHEERLATPLPEKLPDQSLAPTVPIDVCGVEERHARIGSRMERTQAGAIVHGAPVAADRPCPEADRADHAPGLPEPAVLHVLSPSGWCSKQG